jgi:hypothetical protein
MTCKAVSDSLDERFGVAPPNPAGVNQSQQMIDTGRLHITIIVAAITSPRFVDQTIGCGKEQVALGGYPS